MKWLLPICLVLAAILTGAEPAQLDTDRDGMPDEWEIAFGLEPADPKDASLDPDQDSLPNLDEYRAGTNPTNGQSTLQFTTIRILPSFWRAYIEFLTVTGITYRLEYKSVLADQGWNHIDTFVATGGSSSLPDFGYPNIMRYYRLLASRSSNMQFTASLNITGSALFTASPGTNYFFTHLRSADHRVSSLVHNPPYGTLVINDRAEAATYDPDFYEAGWDNPNLILSPGRNFTVVNPAAEPFFIYLAGEALQPVISTTSGGSQIAILIIGERAGNYALQRSSNLRAWQSLHTNVGPSAFTFDLTGSDLRHYFRALYLP